MKPPYHGHLDTLKTVHNIEMSSVLLCNKQQSNLA